MRRRPGDQRAELENALNKLTNAPLAGDKSQDMIFDSLRVFLLLSKLHEFQCSNNPQENFSYYQLLILQHAATNAKFAILNIKPTHAVLLHSMSNELINTLYIDRSNADALDAKLQGLISELLHKINVWDSDLKTRILKKEVATTYIDFIANLIVYCFYYVKYNTLLNVGFQFTEFAASYFKRHEAQQGIRLGMAICSAGYFYCYGVLSPALFVLFAYMASQAVKLQHNAKIVLPAATIIQQTHINLGNAKFPILNEVWLLRLVSMLLPCLYGLLTAEPVLIYFALGNIIVSMGANAISRLSTHLYERVNQQTLSPQAKVYAELILTSLFLKLSHGAISNLLFEIHVREAFIQHYLPDLAVNGRTMTCNAAPHGAYSYPEFTGRPWLNPKYYLTRRDSVRMVETISPQQLSQWQCTSDPELAKDIEQLTNCFSSLLADNGETAFVELNCMEPDAVANLGIMRHIGCKSHFITGGRVRIFQVPFTENPDTKAILPSIVEPTKEYDSSTIALALRNAI